MGFQVAEAFRVQQCMGCELKGPRDSSLWNARPDVQVHPSAARQMIQSVGI